DPDDAALALGELDPDVPRPRRLPAGVPLAGTAARVDHESRVRPGVAEGRHRLLDVERVVVRTALAAAEDHVAVGVAAGGDDRAEPLLGHAEKPMGVSARTNGVDRDLHPPVGAVLDADGHREARRELPVHLALRLARSARSPRDTL